MLATRLRASSLRSCNPPLSAKAEINPQGLSRSPCNAMCLSLAKQTMIMIMIAILIIIVTISTVILILILTPIQTILTIVTLLTLLTPLFALLEPAPSTTPSLSISSGLLLLPLAPPRPAPTRGSLWLPMDGPLGRRRGLAADSLRAE